MIKTFHRNINKKTDADQVAEHGDIFPNPHGQPVGHEPELDVGMPFQSDGKGNEHRPGETKPDHVVAPINRRRKYVTEDNLHKDEDKQRAGHVPADDVGAGVRQITEFVGITSQFFKHVLPRLGETMGRRQGGAPSLHLH